MRLALSNFYRHRIAPLVCFLIGHKWETTGGVTWTEYGPDYDSYTECARCWRSDTDGDALFSIPDRLHYWRASHG